MTTIKIGNHKVEMLDEHIPYYLSHYLNNNYELMNMNNKVKFGDTYITRDNSWSINIETGKYAHPNECWATDENEIGSTYTVVSKPYIDHVSIYLGDPERLVISREFVNIKSSKTGNIYRVLLH